MEAPIRVDPTYLEYRKFTVEEIAKFFRVPAHLIRPIDPAKQFVGEENSK